MYGLNEYARPGDLDLEVAAKLDTGAKTASLSARDIKRFKRNGESWVRFYRHRRRPFAPHRTPAGTCKQDQAPGRRL